MRVMTWRMCSCAPSLPNALFHLLERIQGEVHRFAITFHRDKRSKHQTASVLDGIKGIGSKTKEALLAHFKTVKRIKEASAAELEVIVGKSNALVVKGSFLS